MGSQGDTELGRLGSGWIPRCFLFSLPFAQTTAVSGHVVRWDQGLGSRPFWAGSYKCAGGFTQPFLGPTFLQGIYRVPTVLMGPSGTEMVCVCTRTCVYM